MWGYLVLEFLFALVRFYLLRRCRLLTHNFETHMAGLADGDTEGRLAWHASRHVTFRMLLRGSRGTCGTGPRSSDCCLRFFSLQFVTTLYSFIQWFILTHTHDIVTRKSLTHLLSHTPPLPHTVMVAHSPPPISVLSISFLTIVWYLLEIDMRGDPVLSFSK